MIFCDECKNFPPPDHPIWRTKRFEKHQCLLGLPMLFRMPRSPNDEDWGFYKKECKRFLPKERELCPQKSNGVMKPLIQL